MANNGNIELTWDNYLNFSLSAEDALHLAYAGQGPAHALAWREIKRQGLRCSCGAPFDKRGDGVSARLCNACYDEAGLENEHADGYHDGAPNARCIDCRQGT